MRFQFSEKRRQLYVDADQALVARLVRTIQSESGIEGIEAVNPDHISEIWIQDESQWRKEVPRTWRDRLALVGCGIICFAIMFVLTAGIYAIFELFQRAN